jgi:hypothetical protein
MDFDGTTKSRCLSLSCLIVVYKSKQLKSKSAGSRRTMSLPTNCSNLANVLNFF